MGVQIKNGHFVRGHRHKRVGPRPKGKKIPYGGRLTFRGKIYNKDLVAAQLRGEIFSEK